MLQANTEHWMLNVEYWILNANAALALPSLLLNNDNDDVLVVVTNDKFVLLGNIRTCSFTLSN